MHEKYAVANRKLGNHLSICLKVAEATKFSPQRRRQNVPGKTSLCSRLGYKQQHMQLFYDASDIYDVALLITKYVARN
jgi:hypothetical protein